MIVALALAAAQVDAVASLGVLLPNDSYATVQVRRDNQSGHVLTVDCVSKCANPLHFEAGLGEAPLGLVDLQTDGLVYSVWGTGCCYIVRVWQVVPTGVKLLLETASRTQPSLLVKSGLTVETYMRPTDKHGREIGIALKPMKWTYRQGRFVHS